MVSALTKESLLLKWEFQANVCNMSCSHNATMHPVFRETVAEVKLNPTVAELKARPTQPAP